MKNFEQVIMDHYVCFYWINLDKDIERRKNMETLFISHGYRNVRIPAILGGPTTKDKENACTLSHIKAIMTFVKESRDEYAIICEDDLSMDYKKYWRESLTSVINSAPRGWGIIQLGVMLRSLDQAFTLSESKYLPRKDDYWSTICYIINRKAAIQIISKVLLNPEKCLAPSDVVIYSLTNTFTYKYPMFTYIDNNTSNIHPGHVTEHARSKSLIEKFLIKNFRNL